MPLVSIIALCMLTAAMALVVVRLIQGPRLADRVVALDVLAAVAIGFIAAYVEGTGATALLDAALVLALVAFVATAAFARFVEHADSPNEIAS